MTTTAPESRGLPTPEQAIHAATLAAEAHAAADTPWPVAVHHTVRSLIRRLAAARALPKPDLAVPDCPDAEAALDALGPLDGWHILDIGEVHQHLLELELAQPADGRPAAVRAKGQGARAEQGAWYTPPEVAQAMCRLSIGPQLDRLAQHSDPHQILQILAIDPACGAGVFLLEAARYVADRYAERLWGHPRRPVQLLIDVMQECVFGVDIDPVAVDLSKAALWIEVDGCVPFGFMDRNIVCADPLAGPEAGPPAFLERCPGRPSAAA